MQVGGSKGADYRYIPRQRFIISFIIIIIIIKDIYIAQVRKGHKYAVHTTYTMSDEMTAWLRCFGYVRCFYGFQLTDHFSARQSLQFAQRRRDGELSIAEKHASVLRCSFTF